MADSVRPDRAAAQETGEWLRSEPSLVELQDRYKDVWKEVEAELVVRFRKGGNEVQAYLQRLERQALAARPTSTGSGKQAQETFAAQVRYRMAREAARRHYVSIASGVESGTVRFNLINGFIAQKLLFSDGLERKPVSLFWFRLFWPLLWQRRMLMPLVQPEGIYCFYSRELVARLAELIGSSRCIEIAAGDGTLTRFLMDAGTSITASDDYSWKHSVRYPGWVNRMEAREALRHNTPEVVLCSWPPAGNDFERQVFRTKSVRLYIVIGSRHHHAAGNWNDYRDQNVFEMEERPDLGALVVPPELDPMVYMFRRKVGGG